MQLLQDFQQRLEQRADKWWLSSEAHTAVAQHTNVSCCEASGQFAMITRTPLVKHLMKDLSWDNEHLPNMLVCGPFVNSIYSDSLIVNVEKYVLSEK